jgi:hypothetical protein
MEWLLIILGVILAPVAWAMIQRGHRGERSDESYNGESSDATLMEIGREYLGNMRR